MRSKGLIWGFLAGILAVGMLVGASVAASEMGQEKGPTLESSTGYAGDELDRVMGYHYEAAVEADLKEQVTALEDGRVSRAEYESGIDRMLSCLRVVDPNSVEDLGVEWMGIRHEFVARYSENGELRPAHYDACYAVHLEQVDAGFQIQHEQLKNYLESLALGCLMDRLPPDERAAIEAAPLGTTFPHAVARSKPADTTDCQEYAVGSAGLDEGWDR